MSFGSQRGFAYVDDDGAVYAIRADESNVEMVNTTAPTPPVGSEGLPMSLHKRYIRLRSGDGSSKTIPILTRLRYTEIQIGQAFAAPAIGEENVALTSFVVTAKVPERIMRAVVAVDTGKTDGDQP